MNRYMVFRGPERPEVNPSGPAQTRIISVYEPQADQRHELSVVFRSCKTLPNATNLIGRCEIEGQQYKVNIYMTTDNPGEDKIILIPTY